MENWFQPHSSRLSECVVPLPICDEHNRGTAALNTDLLKSTERSYSPNNFIMRLHQVSLAAEKNTNLPLKSNHQYSNRIIQSLLPIMQQNYSHQPICSVYSDSDNPFVPNYSNEFALSNSYISSNGVPCPISHKAKEMSLNSKLNPYSPPFNFYLNKKSPNMHQLNPEAKEYIPQHLRNNKSLSSASEVDRKNAANSQASTSQLDNSFPSLKKEIVPERIENYFHRGYSASTEKTSDPSRDLKDYAYNVDAPPICLSPRHSNNDCMNLSNGAYDKPSSDSFVAVVISPVTRLNIVDDSDHHSPCVLVKNDELDECSLYSFEDSSLDESSSVKINLPISKQESCHPSGSCRSFSESSVDSNDSFQIEFNDDDQDDSCLHETSSSCQSCAKSRSLPTDLFASQSSDDEVQSDSESEDEGDTCDGDYTDEFFSLDYEDPPCKLDINNLLPSETSSSIESTNEDVCDSSNTFKAINEKWSTEVKRGCKGSTMTKVKFCVSAKVHPMIVWKYAYQSARYGSWMEAARDRERFKFRIDRTAETLNRILNPAHRCRMFSLIHSQADKT